MSLLRTSAIKVDSILAFTGVEPEDGNTFLWGNPKDFSLERGDMVKVLDIERRPSTSWAKVLVAVIKGKCTGRVGYVSMDLGTRLQRSWQALTPTGSMAPVRATGKNPRYVENSPDVKSPPESGVRGGVTAPTVPGRYAVVVNKKGAAHG